MRGHWAGRFAAALAALLFLGATPSFATRTSAVRPAADPGTWSPTGSLAQKRWFHSATLLKNGKVLVAGGDSCCSGALASAELYDPTTGTWSATGSMNGVRSSHTATLLPDGKVLVTGGIGVRRRSLASAELYDPATGVWTLTGSMHDTRFA